MSKIVTNTLFFRSLEIYLSLVRIGSYFVISVTECLLEFRHVLETHSCNSRLEVNVCLTVTFLSVVLVLSPKIKIALAWLHVYS